MKRNNTLIYIVAILALIAGVYFTWFRNSDAKKRFNWEKTFSDGDVQPYDFGFLKKLLKHETTQKFNTVVKNLSNELDDLKDSDSSSYFFIGEYCYYTRPEIDSLLNFAEMGHQVVIVAEQFPDTLQKALQEFGKPFTIERSYNSEANVDFTNTNSPYASYQFRFRSYDQKEETVNWNYISEDDQLDYYYGSEFTRYLRLGHINEHVNFAKFRVGKGFVYLHTNPLLFTNYYMANDTGFAHARHVFSEIKTRNVLYDVAARYMKQDGVKTVHQSDTPLAYILKQKSLRMAWYFLLAAVVLFFLFKAKREQRIIPVLEQKRNTSLNFVETISGLYFKYNDHKKMADIKLNLFYAFLRQKLGIATKDIDEAMVIHIANKAKVPLQDTQNIFNFIERHLKSNSPIEASELIQFNSYIETFYHYYNAKK